MLASWSHERAERVASLTAEMATLLEAAPPSVRRRYLLPAAVGIDAVAAARFLYAQRRARDGIFADHAGLFAEPAWDLLLDLFIARGERREVATSAACIGSCVPYSTALRCLKALEGRGLVAGREHPRDRRVRLLELTDLGAELVENFLRQV